MIWDGRNDGDDVRHQRIFQKVILESDYEQLQLDDFAIHGFAVDEGVRRNKGRVGAKDAPNVIRKNMSNFPVVHPHIRIFDFGDHSCEDAQLENTQEQFADSIKKVIEKGAKSVVFGGGHEVTFAHYSGLKKAFPKEKIGIINIDAHFDNRKPEMGVGASSGTGFWQIAQDQQIYSLHIGIQRNSNTQQLFDTAHQFGMKYLLADELYFDNLPSIYKQIDDLTQQTDQLYLTICMDVFNAAIAPGVSAAAYNGIFADATFMHFFRHILKNEKLVAVDVAEVNPTYDKADRTARLAANLINEWFMV